MKSLSDVGRSGCALASILITVGANLVFALFVRARDRGEHKVRSGRVAPTGTTDPNANLRLSCCPDVGGLVAINAILGEKGWPYCGASVAAACCAGGRCRRPFRYA